MRFGLGSVSAGTWKRTVTLAAVAAALGLLMSEAHAGELPKKLEREMRIMTRTIDDALVESPNLFVQSTEPTSGIYVDAVGAVFAFKAALVRENFNSWNWIGDHDVEIRRHGGKIVIYRDGFEDEDEDDDVSAEEKKTERKSLRKVRQNGLDRRFQRGKDELIDVLLDAGDILESLKDTDNVVIAANFSDSDYLDDKEISQVTLKARVSDLRAYANGTLNRESAIAKVSVIEN